MQNIAEIKSDLLTVSEVARELRWDDTTVRRNIKNGAIPTWAVVTLPHKGDRQAYRIKHIWLDRLIAGKDTSKPKEQ